MYFNLSNSCCYMVIDVRTLKTSIIDKIHVYLTAMHAMAGTDIHLSTSNISGPFHMTQIDNCQLSQEKSKQTLFNLLLCMGNFDLPLFF